MGIRQMSQPLGVAAAAVVVPPLAAQHGIAAPFLVSGVVLAVLAVACGAGIRNPPRAAAAASVPRAGNPYRGSGFLLRIHVVSVLLVIPQFTVATFGMVYLISALDWPELAAGILVGVSQVVGAFGRIAVGALSDRVGSRVRVLRWVALAAIAVMLVLGVTGALHGTVAGAIALVIAATVTVADNGLAFTSVAEAAGSAWTGKALGIQNTGQFLAASAVGPAVGALITVAGYPLALALVAIAPLPALPLVPKTDAHRAGRRAAPSAAESERAPDGRATRGDPAQQHGDHPEHRDDGDDRAAVGRDPLPAADLPRIEEVVRDPVVGRRPAHGEHDGEPGQRMQQPQGHGRPRDRGSGREHHPPHRGGQRTQRMQHEVAPAVVQEEPVHDAGDGEIDRREPTERLDPRRRRAPAQEGDGTEDERDEEEHVRLHREVEERADRPERHPRAHVAEPGQQRGPDQQSDDRQHHGDDHPRGATSVRVGPVAARGCTRGDGDDVRRQQTSRSGADGPLHREEAHRRGKRTFEADALTSADDGRVLS